MKIGAYQFVVTGDIRQNFACIEKAILAAARQNVRLLVFPEMRLDRHPTDPKSRRQTRLIFMW
jgi:predicted amidohydrolase